mmetsp:Transcript_20926/g.43675  ORF Transcript_20926/g.43675 Transcript_20926/m.43675 type:complete len:230 (-) Transcript_20926:730-1419(-)
MKLTPAVPLPSLAAGAVAVRFEGPFVEAVLITLHPHGSRTFTIYEGYAEPSRPRWVDAVVHVDSEGRANDKVEGVSDTHEVPWLVCGETLAALAYNLPEVVLALPPRKPSDCVSWYLVVPPPETFKANLPEASHGNVESPLYDSKEVLLLLVGVGVDAPVQPSEGSIGGLFEPRVIVVDGGDDIVQLHHNVGGYTILRPNALLRLQEDLLLVVLCVRGLELYACLCYFR